MVAGAGARGGTTEVLDAKGRNDCVAAPAGLLWPEANLISARGGQCVIQRLALALARPAIRREGAIQTRCINALTWAGP